MPLTNYEIGTVFKFARDVGATAKWTPEGGIRLSQPAKRNWRKNPSRAQGYLYFILAGKSGLMKIGFSRDPGKRFDDLSTGSPEALTLCGALLGSFGAESVLHRRFKHLRVRGEWFRATDELMAYIAEASRR